MRRSLGGLQDGLLQILQQFISTKDTGWGGQLLTYCSICAGGIFAERLASEWKSLQDEDCRTFYGAIPALRRRAAFRSVTNP